MRTTTTSFADFIPDAVADFARRVGAWTVGVGLIAAAIGMGLALASWSARDPSFNHAVAGPTRNLLGPLGAISADLAMQLIGLAAIAALTPLALWGWRLAARGRLERPFLRLALLIVGVVAASAVAAALPATDRWPLPTGLGGVVGDFVLAAPRKLFGRNLGSVSGALGFALAAVLALSAASGLGMSGRSAELDDDDSPAAYEARVLPRTGPEKLESDDSDGEPGVALILAGAAIHLLLSAQAGLRRLFGLPGRARLFVGAAARRAAEARAARQAIEAAEAAEREAAQASAQAAAAAAAAALAASRAPVVELEAHAPAPPVEVAPAAMARSRIVARREPSFEPVAPPTALHAPNFAPAPTFPATAEFAPPVAPAFAAPTFAAPASAPTALAPTAPAPASPASSRLVIAPAPAPALSEIEPLDDLTPFDIDEPILARAAHLASEDGLAVPARARVAAPVPVAPDCVAPVAQTAPVVHDAPVAPAPPAPARAASGGQRRRVARETGERPHVYEPPSPAMLSAPKKTAERMSDDALEQNARLLEGVLDDFNVKGEIISVHPGPVVTLYELEPAPGVKSSRVIGLADDIARSMSAISARVAVVPGRNAIGVELPNAKRETVYLREMFEHRDFQESKHKLAIALGKTIGGEPISVDLAKMPHLLVAGTTGSGKSVAINTMILSLVYRMRPDQCRLIMVDPKMLELSVYDGIPHLLTPVVTDPKKAVVALKWAVREMEDRYKKMSKVGVRNIDGFNARVAEAKAKGEVITREVQTGFDRDTGELIYETEEMDLSSLPYIVVIVDEMADLMMVAGKDIEGAIQRLAQMARAAGIHLIMATQRPSVDVITGTIKANFPTRISFQVTSKIDSRTILGEQGAEQLLGQGDMLYMAGGGRITRVHGPFVADAEVERIVAYLKTQGAPEYLDAITQEEDEGPAEDSPVAGVGSMDAEESGDLYDRAVAIVLRDKRVSTSYIQRRLSVGYNKAASLIERMEKEGVVSPPSHSGKREILAGGGVDRGAFDLPDED
jgi:S-DNA-T family DNA segregation ATPase FtsK/SpoIIIE